MDTILIDSKNSKTSNLHRLLLYLSGKAKLKRNEKCFTLSNSSIYYVWKNIKRWYKKNNISSNIE